MILRIIPIIFSGLAIWLFWFGFGQLGLLRGTPFWEFRYIVFLLAVFLGLSLVDWALVWLERKLEVE